MTNFEEMKFYRHLFQHMKELTPNEGIVYSEILFHSLMETESYTADGQFSRELAVEGIMDDGDGCITYQPLSEARLMKRTCMSYPTVQKAVRSLKSKLIIAGNRIKCPPELIERGYIEIPPDTSLRGRMLIFYGLLLDRSAPYGGITDTWAYRYEEICGVKKDNYYWLISQLQQRGFVERLEDGRLRIIKKEQASQHTPSDKF